MKNQALNYPDTSHSAQKMPIMAHLVLGYPSLPESIRTAEKYIAAGVQILELQIPFSHPTADGPVITAACQQATQQGVSMADCIQAIQMLRSKFPAQEMMVMSYLNRIYAFGFQAFLQKLEQAEIQHLIVPDLPADLSSVFLGDPCRVKLVPVLAANTSHSRLQSLLDLGFDFYYLMSDFKITGSGFSLHANLQQLIQQIKNRYPGNLSRIGIGFGISTPAQARLVAAEVDYAIIGSSLIQAQNTGKLEEYLESLQLAFNTL